MTTITSFPALTGPGVRNGPFLVLTLDGSGCGLGACRCSSPDFITLSDGVTTIKIELSRSAAQLIRERGIYDYEENPTS